MKMPKAKHRENGQVKKNIGLALTQEAVEGLDQLADGFNISRAHFVELIGLRRIIVSSPNQDRLGE